MKSKILTREQAFHAIETSEFGNDVIASKSNVAVILTQDWCPQWHYMREWIYDLDIDLDLYELEYNKVDCFDEFRNFKEKTLLKFLIYSFLLKS